MSKKKERLYRIEGPYNETRRWRPVTRAFVNSFVRNDVLWTHNIAEAEIMSWPMAMADVFAAMDGGHGCQVVPVTS